jgi:hypothetical protein
LEAFREAFLLVDGPIGIGLDRVVGKDLGHGYVVHSPGKVDEDAALLGGSNSRQLLLDT